MIRLQEVTWMRKFHYSMETQLVFVPFVLPYFCSLLRALPAARGHLLGTSFCPWNLHLHLWRELLPHWLTSWYYHPCYLALLTEEETKCCDTFWVAEPKKDVCMLMNIELLFLKELKYTIPVISSWKIFSHQIKLRIKTPYMYECTNVIFLW